ncbi:hypothetical protein [Streptomyces sp. NRRL S-813]|uniref:hypothetical protein n=1 Tax=Streptomyces sp. NRRL S-813 TaxID=1463919 RepID=UPI000AD23E24|nr:hypothetical protein [Streptomyces sp. NRRL S-813]
MEKLVELGAKVELPGQALGQRSPQAVVRSAHGGRTTAAVTRGCRRAHPRL